MGMFAFGEVRELATGCIEHRNMDARMYGAGRAWMQTAQHIWNGEKWCEFGTDEAVAVLAEISRQKHEPFPSQSWHGG